jgi:hypothetical protein
MDLTTLTHDECRLLLDLLKERREHHETTIKYVLRHEEMHPGAEWDKGLSSRACADQHLARANECGVLADKIATTFSGER